MHTSTLVWPTKKKEKEEEDSKGLEEMSSMNCVLRLVAFLSAALTAATQDYSVVDLRVSKIAADGSITVLATSPVSITSFRFDIVGGIGKASPSLFCV